VGLTYGEVAAMSFSDAVKTCFSKYVTFTGRASRPEFWFFTLFIIILDIVVTLIDLAIGSQILSLIVGLGLLLPSITVTVRRLHDTDRSGAWWFIGLVPIIGWIVLLVFLVSSGTPGPNQYDEPAVYGTGTATA
jgi:uncharacterized membrane protein YhaH (DUF805 family)